MTALEQEERFLKQKLASLEASFDDWTGRIVGLEEEIFKLEEACAHVEPEIEAIRRQLGMEVRS